MLSNQEMKPLARCVMLGVAGLLVAALFATAALTNEQSSMISQPVVAGSTNLGLAPINSAPIVYLDGKQDHSQQLKPGVYQNRPYAIILIVPEAGIDDRCVVGASGNFSKMPNAKPDIQLVPKRLSQ